MLSRLFSLILIAAFTLIFWTFTTYSLMGLAFFYSAKSNANKPMDWKPVLFFVAAIALFIALGYWQQQWIIDVMIRPWIG